MSKMIGVFGGSFNPPHVGHVMAAMYALSVGRFDKVLVVPTFQHAFAKDLIDFEHRLKMTRLAFRVLPDVVVTDIERNLSTPSYMVNTLHHIKMGYYLTIQQQVAIFGAALVSSDNTAAQLQVDPVQLRLILGTDCSSEKDKWHKWEEIEEIASPYILPRRDERLFPAVSSTLIRRLGGAFGIQEAAAFVPGTVLDYIEKHGLYIRG